MDSLIVVSNWLSKNVDVEQMFRFILAFQVGEFVLEQYIGYRQHKIYKNTTTMPSSLIGITKKETFEKARVYALDKSYFGFVSDFYNFAINIALLGFNGLALMWTTSGVLLSKWGFEQSEIWQGAVFLIIMNTVSAVMQLPFSIYHTFWLEERHGFNKQTASFFIKDKIKQFLLLQVLCVAIGAGVTYIVMVGGNYFFIYLWMFMTVVILFFMTIYPSLIAPLFDKYTPLPDGDLRTQIEQMAANIDFPLKKLYVVEGSKRSAHSNAYFYGFFNNKRIVLFDTLLKGEGEDKEKGCSDSEVLAVLGHELGHWKLNHVLKNMIVVQVNMLLMFVTFAVLFKCKPLYQALGFNSTPILIGLLVLVQYVMAPYNLLLNWIMAQISRRYEFQADQFAKTLGRTYSLKSALIKLNADNLGFPIYDPWYSSMHNSHPPLVERLQALETDRVPATPRPDTKKDK